MARWIYIAMALAALAIYCGGIMTGRRNHWGWVVYCLGWMTQVLVLLERSK